MQQQKVLTSSSKTCKLPVDCSVSPRARQNATHQKVLSGIFIPSTFFLCLQSHMGVATAQQEAALSCSREDYRLTFSTPKRWGQSNSKHLSQSLLKALYLLLWGPPQRPSRTFLLQQRQSPCLHLCDQYGTAFALFVGCFAMAAKGFAKTGWWRLIDGCASRGAAHLEAVHHHKGKFNLVRKDCRGRAVEALQPSHDCCDAPVRQHRTASLPTTVFFSSCNCSVDRLWLFISSSTAAREPLISAVEAEHKQQAGRRFGVVKCGACRCCDSTARGMTDRTCTAIAARYASISIWRTALRRFWRCTNKIWGALNSRSSSADPTCPRRDLSLSL